MFYLKRNQAGARKWATNNYMTEKNAGSKDSKLVLFIHIPNSSAILAEETVMQRSGC